MSKEKKTMSLIKQKLLFYMAYVKDMQPELLSKIRDEVREEISLGYTFLTLLKI